MEKDTKADLKIAVTAKGEDMEDRLSSNSNIFEKFFSGYARKGESNSVDEVFLVLQENIDPELVAKVDKRKLIRKIDLMIMPLAIISMFLFSLDKAVLSYGTLMGFLEDKNLSSNDYSWISSIFSFGYLGANIPVSFLIQKIPLSKFTSSCMIIWGCILIATIAKGAKYHQLLAIRCLLGIFEATITPALAIIFTQYYTRKEQSARMCYWYLGNPINHIIGSLIAYGLSGTTYSNMSSWEVMYILVGCLTIVCGICFYFIVPDSPAKAKFFSKAERVVMVERLRESKQGFGNKQFKVEQFSELILDFRTYIYFVLQFFSNIGWSANSSYGNLFVESLGFSSRTSLLLNCATGGILGISLIVFGILSEITNDRTLWAICSCLLGILGGAIMVGVNGKSTGGSIAGYYLTYASIPLYIFIFILIGANTPGHTKKIFSNCVSLLGSTAGSISGPQFVKNDPKYTKLKIWNLVSFCICAAALIIYRYFNSKENARRDMEETDSKLELPENFEFMDLTAKQNRLFRYVK